MGDESNGSTTIYSGLFEERSNGDRLYHISSPVGFHPYTSVAIPGMNITNSFQ
jgi:hypothetical protein